MVLICDVCHQTIAGTNPTICLFPCFHKYCERCKQQLFGNNRQPNANDNEIHVICKLCNQQFRSNVLYDYSESQIEKIFCLNCNIKNKAPIEWRCKTCQNRFLCAQCSQPHYHSGHEIEPVMKPSIPLRSQCNLHVNVPATYLCSCQSRLCDYCFNIHMNSPPHEQRVPYTKLAEQARHELHNTRQQSQKDYERIQHMKETIIRNKQFIHSTASNARTAVAKEVLELVNAVIRRGNDIVTHIDIIEDTKLKQCNQIEQEMRHWLDRLRKIESFAENALLTVQQDDPGMWSAAMFAQSAISQVNKRRELAKNSVKMMEQQPNISYKSNLTELIGALRSFGLVNMDGDARVPAQSTPQNARMFTITNNPPKLSAANNNGAGRMVQPPGGATIRHGMMLSNNQFAVNQTSTATGATNFALSSSQHGAIQTNSLPQQQQIVRKTLYPAASTSAVGSSISSVTHNGLLLPQLLQQPSIIPPNSTLSTGPMHSNCSTTPTISTHMHTAEQLQIIHQNAILSQANKTQQQQLNRLQSPPLMNINPSQQVFMQMTQQQQQIQQRLLSQQQLIPAPTNAALLQQQQRQQLLQRQQMIMEQQQNQNLQNYRRQAQKQLCCTEQLNAAAEVDNTEQLRILKSRQQLMQHEQQQKTASDTQSTSSLVTSPRIPILMSQINNPLQNATLNPMSSIQTVNDTDTLLPDQQQRPTSSTLAAIATSPNLPIHQFQQQFIIRQATQQPQIQQEHCKDRVSDVVDLVDDEDVKEIPLETTTIIEQQGIERMVIDAEDPLANGSSDNNNNANISLNLQLQATPLRQKAQSAAADSTVTLTLTNNDSIRDFDPLSPVDLKQKLDNAIKKRPLDSNNHSSPTHKRAAVENHSPEKANNETKQHEETNVENASATEITTTTVDDGVETMSEDDEQLTKRPEDNEQLTKSTDYMEIEENNTNDINQLEDVNDLQNNGSTEFVNITTKGKEDDNQKLDKTHKDQSTSKKSNTDELNGNIAEQDAKESTSSSGVTTDWWDDYCYVCSQGCDKTTGSLGCCATCPHVFHANCHVPIINGMMEDLPDDWKCSSCLSCEPLIQPSKEFGYREKLLCSKVYLACFQKYSQIEIFLNKVPETELDYYSLIKNPIWLTAIGQKISEEKYTNISQFVDDMNLLFQNFSTFNPPNTQMAVSGKKVFTYFLNAMRKFLPAYEKQIWVYVTLYNPRHTSAVASGKEDIANNRRTKPGRPRRANSSKSKSQTPA